MCLQACCAATSLVGQGLCGCCKLTCGSFKQQVRFSYLLLFCFCVCLLFLIIWIKPFLEWFGGLGITCPIPGDPICLGASLIYRMSFVLVILHLIIFLILLTRSEFSKNVNEGAWCLKILFVIGVFIGFLWLPNTFSKVYSIIAMVFSIFFLIFQIIMIIDLCYLWNEAWVAAYDEGQKCYSVMLIAFTLALYGGFITLTVFEYIWFAGCSYGTLAVSITLALSVLVTVLPLTRINPRGSIFTSSTVCMYSMYLTWVGLSNMTADCNADWKNKTKATAIYIGTGGVLTLISLLYVTFGDSRKSSGNVKIAGNIDIAKGVLDDRGEEHKKYEEDIEMEAKKQEKQDQRATAASNPASQNNLVQQVNLGNQANRAQVEPEEERGKMSDYTRSNTYLYFHIIMLCAAFYLAMLLTNWGTSDVAGRTFSFDYHSNAGSWFMIGSSWFTLALYAWTIIAPRVLKERAFEPQNQIRH